MSVPRFTFTDRAVPFCEVGFGDARVDGGTPLWDTAIWDDEAARWGAGVVTWQSIHCDVFEASWEQGRLSTTDRFAPGVATLLARNSTGWADVVPGGIRPGRQIRWGVDHGVLGRIVLFHGYVDIVTPSYEPQRADTVEIACVDALGEVNRAALVSFVSPAGEIAHRRIGRLLNAAKWPVAMRDLWATTWTLIGDDQGGQMADLLGRVADSVGGVVWGDRSGRVGFRPQDWQMWDENRPVDFTIGNVEPTDVCPGRWQRPYDRASISTQVIMGQTPETAIEVIDVVGQSLFGLEPFIRTDLLTATETRIADLARRTLATRSWATAPRVRSVSLDARNGPEHLDLLASVDIFAPTHVRARLDLDRGLVFDGRYIATGVAHTMTPTDWTLELNLDVAEPYESTEGTWDYSRWDDAIWSDVHIDPPIPPLPPAYPVVATYATEVGPAIGTANPLPAPAGVAVGDLLLAFVSLDGGQAVSASSGWTMLFGGLVSPHSLHLFGRVADGTASDIITVNGGSGSGNDYCAVVLRVTGHGVANVATDVRWARSGASSAIPDPPSLDATTSRPFLWFAAMCLDRVGTGYSITAMPPDYTQIVNIVSADYSAASALAVAQRARTTQVEDPGPFTQTQSWYWQAATVAVPPGP